MKMTRKALLGGTVLAGMAAAFAVSPALAEKLPYYADEEKIYLTGEVENTSGEEFLLDYGANAITVEMGDWDWYNNEAEALVPGEMVTVSGRVDDDFYEGREIEADTVYVHDRFVYYYASGADTVNDPVYMSRSTAPVTDGSWVSTSGTVTNVTGREFTVNTGGGAISVDTVGMTYNPVDDAGFPQIDVGDRVYVSGVLDDRLFDEREIAATTIIEVSQDQNNMADEG